MKTVRNEGVLALYNGLESTLWRHILWNAGYFGCIFQVRQLLPKAETKKGQMANDILAGSVGGTGRFFFVCRHSWSERAATLTAGRA